MEELFEATGEATNISAKAVTFTVGTALLGMFMLDALIVAPDDSSLPFPVGYTDEVVLLASGLLLVHQSGAIGEVQKAIS